MNTISRQARPATGWRPRRDFVAEALAAAILVAVLASPLAAQNPGALQNPGTFRLWAAQTGPNQVSLAWDSVPGAAEYRIHLGDPSVPGTLTQRPASVLSGSGRGAILTGIRRMANGITLVAVDASGRVLRQESFNPVVPATSFPPVTPPTSVTAKAASASEVTLTWDPVPGATAYYIGRAAFPSGFGTLCALCSTEPRYVDRAVMPGQQHTYTIAAIFPSGISTRVNSNSVTPGQTAPLAGLPTGTPTTATGTTQAPPPGQPTGTPTTASGTTQVTPPGQPAGTLTTATGTTATGATATTTTGTTGTHASSPVTSTTAGTTCPPPTSGSNPLSGILASAMASPPAPPSSVTATATGPAAVRVSWQPSTSSNVCEYVISRIEGNSLAATPLDTVAAMVRDYDDKFFPATLFASGALQVAYVVAARSPGSPYGRGTSNKVVVQPPAAGAGASPPSASIPTCRLEYQRADNMWAAFGRPDGPLGTESISLAAQQNKVFITDWKYEKQRNDGTNYYGSHLRIATNPTSHPIRLHLRSITLTGLLVSERTSSDTFWIRLDPNTSKQFQADLMEVFCE